MSVSQFIEPQANGDLDLYDDILVEDFACEKESFEKLHQKYQEAVKKITTLENAVKEHTVAMEMLEKKNTYLQKNIFTLYKIACTEIKRKSENINSLREQLNSYEKENYLKQRQLGYSKWNGDYQKNNKPSQRDTKQSERKESKQSDVKNTKYSDKSNFRHSSSRERRHDIRRHEEKPSSHRDLRKSETKDNKSLQRKSSRHFKNKTNSSSIKLENSSREHKREDTKQNNCQKLPSSTQKSCLSSVQTKSHTSPLKEKHSGPDDPSKFVNAKRQDSKLIDCQQSVEPVNISKQPSAKSAGSNAEGSKTAGKFPPSDKHRSKMCDPVVASPEVTNKCERNLSPVVSQTCRTSVALNSQEPIVIECFGRSNLEDSHSPIIIPCFSNSMTNSVAHDSMSSEDSDCDDSTPKKKTIVRKLFSPSKPDYDVSVENQIQDDTVTKNHSLEFLNEMKKKLSQEIAAHNRRQQDEDCEDTTQLVNIYQNHKDEYCSNDSVREEQNSLETYSPQPQRDILATTQQSKVDCEDLEEGEIISDDEGKEQTCKDKFSPSQINVNSNSKKMSKHSTKHGSKHTSRQPSKKRNLSGNETVSKISNKQNSRSSRPEHKKRRVHR